MANTWRRAYQSAECAPIPYQKCASHTSVLRTFARTRQRWYRLKSNLGKYFLEYSGSNLISHVKHGLSMESEWVQKAVNLCEAGVHSEYWISYQKDPFNWRMIWSQRLSDEKRSLYWAMRWGLTEVARPLVDERRMKIDEEIICVAALEGGGGAAVMKLLLTLQISRSPIQLSRLLRAMGRTESR